MQAAPRVYVAVSQREGPARQAAQRSPGTVSANSTGSGQVGVAGQPEPAHDPFVAHALHVPDRLVVEVAGELHPPARRERAVQFVGGGAVLGDDVRSIILR